MLKLRNAQSFERFDYPGRYVEKGRGTQLDADADAGGGGRPPRGVAAPATIPFSTSAAGSRWPAIPARSESSVYVIRRVRHEATDNSHLTHSDAEPSRYDNSFEAMPYDVPFRPLRVDGKARSCTARRRRSSSGRPARRSITDKHGRVRVQFHWDRYGKRDDKSSCWIRVSHAWAGRGWGAVNLPHVGHEVIVSFLEGDPDRPLVTGRVYNGENAQDDGDAGQQDAERAEGSQRQRDPDGRQERLGGHPRHAVKDMHVTVDNDREMHVKNHLKETVDNGQEVTIQQGYKETITEGATSTISGGLKSS